MKDPKAFGREVGWENGHVLANIIVTELGIKLPNPIVLNDNYAVC